MATTSDYAPCRVPLQTVDVLGRRLTVHAGIVEDLRWIDGQWRARGGQGAYRIDANTWGFNCRRIAGSSSWSQHSYGWAVDVNSTRNPFTRGPLVTDMPGWFVDLWKARGFGWGGDWRSVRDAMHFSKSPREGGNGRLYVTAGNVPPPGPPPPAPSGKEFNVATLKLVKRGMEGWPVRIVQGVLNGAGVPCHVDGDFGPATDAAVRTFQRAHGLAVDGDVGPQTWGRLLGPVL